MDPTPRHLTRTQETIFQMWEETIRKKEIKWSVVSSAQNLFRMRNAPVSWFAVVSFVISKYRQENPHWRSNNTFFCFNYLLFVFIYLFSTVQQNIGCYGGYLAITPYHCHRMSTKDVSVQLHLRISTQENTVYINYTANWMEQRRGTTTTNRPNPPLYFFFSVVVVAHKCFAYGIQRSLFISIKNKSRIDLSKQKNEKNRLQTKTTIYIQMENIHSLII